MKFQLLAAFSLLFALTLSAPVSQIDPFPNPYPVCSPGEGARIEDCREAITKINTTWPRHCLAVIIKFAIVAEVRTCRITTWDDTSAHCLEGSKVIRAAQRIMSTCVKGNAEYGARVAGRCSFPQTYDKTGVEIVAVPYTAS